MNKQIVRIPGVAIIYYSNLEWVKEDGMFAGAGTLSLPVKIVTGLILSYGE